MTNGAITLTAPPQFPRPLPNLHEEIIIEILLRLPVKSLLKFRCVSKSWLYIICSPYFKKTHLKISAESYCYFHKRLIFGSHRVPVDFYACSVQYVVEDCIYPRYLYPVTEENPRVGRVSFDCPLPSKNSGVWILGSYNGLVCIRLSNNIMILWNPATRKSKALPASGTDFNIKSSMGAHGFGYDQLHDDYKLVELFSNYEMVANEIQVKVYSLRANSWKTLSNFPPVPAGGVFCRCGKFLNGAIHWSVRDLNGPVMSWTIVTHDLATDAFGELPLPYIENDDVIVRIEILGGCLSACCYHYSDLDIWKMNEYGLRESWTKVVCIPFFSNMRYICDIFGPLFLLADGKVVLNYGSSVRIYDALNPVALSHTDYVHIETTTYIESLVSPNFDDEISIRRTLPPEIITEMLLKISGKSLLCFR